jgi:hypothetical protein
MQLAQAEQAVLHGAHANGQNPRGKLHDGEFTHRVTKSDTGPFPFQMI